MKITRTSNAGVLIEAENSKILIDGVTKPYSYYEGTPISLLEKLLMSPPDVLVYTHCHSDHFDRGFAESYKKATGRQYLLPAFSANEDLGDIKIEGIPTRHIGKCDESHLSFTITGEKCVWAVGDASPDDLKKKNLPKPDVVILPFAYFIGKRSWEYTKSLGAEKIILVHMPIKETDTKGIWQAVEDTLGNEKDKVTILKIGETISI